MKSKIQEKDGMLLITFPEKTAKEIVDECNNKVGEGKLVYNPTGWYENEDFYTKEKSFKDGFQAAKMEFTRDTVEEASPNKQYGHPEIDFQTGRQSAYSEIINEIEDQIIICQGYAKNPPWGSSEMWHSRLEGMAQIYDVLKEKLNK